MYRAPAFCTPWTGFWIIMYMNPYRFGTYKPFSDFLSPTHILELYCVYPGTVLYIFKNSFMLLYIVMQYALLSYCVKMGNCVNILCDELYNSPSIPRMRRLTLQKYHIYNTFSYTITHTVQWIDFPYLVINVHIVTHRNRQHAYAVY